jgi:hypothetical protein
MKLIFITGERSMISTIKKLKSTLIGLTVMMLVPSISAHAYDINMPGFTGTVNTTITSGFSLRSSDRDCMLQDGYTYNVTASDLSTAGQLLVASESVLSASQILSGHDKNAKSSGSCAKFQTDGYGNTSTNRLEYGNVNNDNGNLNFKRGDIIDATQKAFVELSGSTDSGIGVDLSFIANYNPVLDITDENFIALTTDARDELESDVQLLDAYITGSFDTQSDLGFIDLTAGRFVTSWGEATFIPVGLNGFVTNALDLTKLRAPGASIRDALMPTEQLTLSMAAGNWGIEAYTQFSSDTVVLDPKGSFFGNDVTGTGGDRILASGAYAEEVGNEAYCPYAAMALGGMACDADLKAYTLATATRADYNDAYQALFAYRNATADQWTTWTGFGATINHGQTFQSMVDEMGLQGSPQLVEVENTLAAFTTAAADAPSLPTVYGGVMDADFTKAATVELRQFDQKESFAKDDGQWGLRASTYLDNIGTGVDLGFYYANYHSKIPYIQMMGKSGVLGGDIIGAFSYTFADQAGLVGGAGIDAPVNTATATAQAAAQGILIPLLNGAYGSGVCGGLGSALAVTAVKGDVDSQAAKRVIANVKFNKIIDDELVHDPSTCDAGNTLGDPAVEYMPIFLSLTPTLAAAVTPLNYARYQFIYPEDLQVFGMSFNTNIGGTTVQGEIAYRPDFPLATAAGDQINQIADASGTTLALTAFGHDTYALAPTSVQAGLIIPAAVNTLAGANMISKDFGTLLKASKRSSLPTIDSSLVKVYDATSYYRSTAYIEYDVMSADIGTTTSFTASHPVTKGLGADSAAFLTELAMVTIDGLDNRNKGFVARNGFNEGSGEHLCLGIFQGLSSAEIAAVNAAATSGGVGATELIDFNLADSSNVSNVGASIVDAVFGNGSYCESQMGADERAFSYRLVGTATYNNFNNSAWSLTPSVVWSHDPSGYGPSSLGGFAEGRQSLSLSLTARKGDAITTSVSYVDQMGDATDNARGDMDYVSANVSYAF